MNYTERLNMIIDSSGMMLKDIAEACQKEGVKLTNTYLSSLKTTPGKIASDEISRAIAKVCGAQYENILVVQAYIDKAPDVFIEFFENVLLQNKLAMAVYEAHANEEVKTVLDDLKEEQEGSYAEMICAYNEICKNTKELEDYKNMLIEKAKQKPEPKAMIISAEQLKHIKFVDEKDIEVYLSKK